jgi:energy-coupling factor transport system substrate-specific component
VALAAVVVRLAASRDAGVVTALVAGSVCGVLSALIAAPIAALVFGGVTGGGTDLLVAMFQQAGSDLQTAVLQQALLSDSIDKAISYVLVFTVIAALSRRLATRFPQGDRVVPRTEASS